MVKLLRRVFNRQPFYNCEVCQRCYRRVELVWHAPDYLWAQITGHEDGGGILCVGCFDRLADGKVMLYWSCNEGGFQVKL